MQGLEHRTSHVPVVVVGLEVERVGVCQKARQAVGDLTPCGLVDPDVDLYVGLVVPPRRRRLMDLLSGGVP